MKHNPNKTKEKCEKNCCSPFRPEGLCECKCHLPQQEKCGLCLARVGCSKHLPQQPEEECCEFCSPDPYSKNVIGLSSCRQPVCHCHAVEPEDIWFKEQIKQAQHDTLEQVKKIVEELVPYNENAEQENSGAYEYWAKKELKEKILQALKKLE